MQRWVERPEARWALWAGIVGAVSTAAVSTWKIVAEGTAAAGLSFVLVPLAAAFVAVPAGVWGLALGHVVLHLRGRASEPKAAFWLALMAVVLPPVAVAWDLWHR
jgi:hypothetical protein